MLCHVLDCNELVLHGAVKRSDSGWLENVSDCTRMLVCNHKAQLAPANLSVCTWTGIDSAHAIARHFLQASVDSSSGCFSPSAIFLHIAILLIKKTKKQSEKHLKLPAGFAKRPICHPEDSALTIFVLLRTWQGFVCATLVGPFLLGLFCSLFHYASAARCLAVRPLFLRCRCLVQPADNLLAVLLTVF
jgi:hypothetical protein